MSLQKSINTFFQLDKKIFLVSFFVFPLLVIGGTLSHELGHVLVAKFFNYDTVLHYGSMNWYFNDVDGETLKSLDYHHFLITIGGVFQTMIFGTIGLFIIRKKTSGLMFWIGISLSLFWSRMLFNLLIIIINIIFFNTHLLASDEIKMSQYLNLPTSFFSILLGFISFLVCLYTTLKIQPKYRLSFLLGGFISGFSMFILWFSYLGPLVLP